MNMMIELDDMNIPKLTEKDFDKMVKNPFANRFTPEEKFRAYLEAFIADNGWSKEYVQNEVDIVFG